MSKLVWDKSGERLYETGVDRGVLYPIQTGGVYSKGVAWNGLSNVTESPSGAEATAIYADNIKYLNLVSAEEFGATIEAYMYPDEFAECDGSVEIVPGMFAGQQSRKTFGLSYRTILGNDTENNDYGHKLHLVYGALAAPSEKGYSTVNDSPEAITFSWEVSTTPVEIATLIDGKKLKPTACLTFDSTKVKKSFMDQLETILYGTDAVYTALAAEPGDWATSYTNYFEKVGNEYVKLSGAIAPTYEPNKYYSETTAGVDGRLPMPDEIIELYQASMEAAG